MAKKPAGKRPTAKAKKQSFYEVVTEAVADLTAHGFDSKKRVDDWLAKLREAAEASLLSEKQMQRLLRDSMGTIYTRLVEQQGAIEHHPGVGRFTLDKVKPALHRELERRIHASADLIKRNRAEAISSTLRRFEGWATSVPEGGSKVQDKPEVKGNIAKALKQLPFEERRVIIDQGHKLTATINDVVAQDGGAIAMRWASHWRQSGYAFRKDHKERDGKIYLIRDSWAHKQGLVKPGDAGYLDEHEMPAELPFCRCFGVYIFSPRRLPEDMVTAKGREAMEAARAKAREMAAG